MPAAGILPRGIRLAEGSLLADRQWLVEILRCEERFVEMLIEPGLLLMVGTYGFVLD